MEPEGSKKANTAAKATEGLYSSVKTETSTVSDIGASSEKGSKNDRPVRKKRSYLRLGKIAGVAGVCLMCVFAASMTSEANRNYWVRGFKYLTGNDTKVRRIGIILLKEFVIWRVMTQELSLGMI